MSSRDIVFIPDLSVFGRVLTRNYAMSLVTYEYMGNEYEVYMSNDELIEMDTISVEYEDEDGL